MRVRDSIADVVDELKLEAVFLEHLALVLDAPVGAAVEAGKEAVSVRRGVYLGDADALAAVEQRHVDACAADDESVVPAEGDGLVKGVDDLRTGDAALAAGENDVAAVLEGLAAGEGVERFAPEDDGPADLKRLRSAEMWNSSAPSRPMPQFWETQTIAVIFVMLQTF